MEEQKVNNIRICRICNTNEAKPNQKRCQPCISKSNNEQLNAKNYYKEYYELHKEEFLENVRKQYRRKNPEIKQRGRPKKCQQNNI